MRHAAGKAILILAFLSCQTMIRRAQKGEIEPDLREYAAAVQVALTVFVVGGSFVTFQYREIYWHFVGITMAFPLIAENSKVIAPPAVEPVPDVELEEPMPKWRRRA